MANKTASKSKTLSTKKPLSAHGLLSSLSYWGTATRMVLVAILLCSAYAINVSLQTEWDNIDIEMMFLIYGLGVIFLLDFGYVIVARALKLNSRLDRLALIASDIFLTACFVLPSFTQVGGTAPDKLRALTLFIALLIISIRILLGLLFAKRK